MQAMSHPKGTWNHFLLLAILVVVLTPLCSPAQTVVVVPATSRFDSLSFKDLQKIFKGQSVDASKGVPLQIVEYGPASDEFYTQLYEQNAYTIGKHWLRLIFSGERVLPPKSVSKIEKFVRILTARENAIGFLPAAVFEKVRKEAIRAIVVDGRDYRHPQYGLRKKRDHN